MCQCQTTALMTTKKKTLNGCSCLLDPTQTALSGIPGITLPLAASLALLPSPQLHPKTPIFQIPGLFLSSPSGISLPVCLPRQSRRQANRGHLLHNVIDDVIDDNISV